MRARSTAWAWCVGLALLMGCPDGDDDDSAGDDDTAGGFDGDPCSNARLPQAVGGALWANPDVYPAIPLRVEVDGDVTAVAVAVGDGDPVDAEPDGDGEGRWRAEVPVDVLADGFHGLTVTAACGDGGAAEVGAELGVGRAGIRLTDFDEVGAATTPRLHALDDALLLTWVAIHDDHREAWAQQLDGAGRPLGERVRLTGDDDGDTLYAHTAVLDQAQTGPVVGVLYQEAGQPYVNRLTVVDLGGNALLGPIELDPEGGSGAPRGDVAADGDGFVAAYRVYLDDGRSEVRWLRVDAVTEEVAGPVTVAAEGDSDPIGGFEPFVFVNVAAVGETSMVSFVRGRYDGWIEMDLPKTQFATFDRDGTLQGSEYGGPEADWTWHWECRLAALDDGFVGVWTYTDLTDPDPDSPTLLVAARADADGVLDPERGAGAPVLDAPYDRMDPFAAPHPDHAAVLAWTDLRSYAETPDQGRIELTVAALDDDLAAIDPVVFPHAVFIAGSSELNGAIAGSNLVLVWEDERHGNGIMDPRPEVVLETAWF